jgi:hypothetical protein
MEAVRTYFKETVQRCIPEGCHLYNTYVVVCWRMKLNTCSQPARRKEIGLDKSVLCPSGLVLGSHPQMTVMSSGTRPASDTNHVSFCLQRRMESSPQFPTSRSTSRTTRSSVTCAASSKSFTKLSSR